MNLLFLDDDERRVQQFQRLVIEHSVVFAENADVAIEALNTISFDIAFLDHDLGGEVFVDSHKENTGYQVAKHIAASNIQFSRGIILHSLNPVGVQNMKAILEKDHLVYVIPFFRLVIEIEDYLV